MTKEQRISAADARVAGADQYMLDWIGTRDVSVEELASRNLGWAVWAERRGLCVITDDLAEEIARWIPTEAARLLGNRLSAAQVDEIVRLEIARRITARNAGKEEP